MVSHPGAPEIETPQEYLSEVKHRAESNVELTFKITAKPAPTIEWFKDGRELKPTTQISFKHTSESSSLFLKETTRLNSGSYEVKVKNSLGSAYATVKLLIQGERFVNPDEGHSLHVLICSIDLEIHGILSPCYRQAGST